MKKCVRCKKKKSLSSFYKNKRAKDGYSYYCKSCQNELTKLSIQKKNGPVVEVKAPKIKPDLTPEILTLIFTLLIIVWFILKGILLFTST